METERAGFVGRRAEWAALDEALGRALRFNAPQAVTIVGADGLGKSRLLDEWLAGHQSQDLRIVRAAVGPAGPVTRTTLSLVKPACFRTRCWNFGSFGSPNGLPNMNGVITALGGRVFSTCGKTSARTVVGKPRSSSICAIALTARVHSGQTGHRTTALTWSACSAAAMPSADFTISAGSVDPMTLKCVSATLPITPSAASSRSRSIG